MYGLEAINHANGWAMAAVGASIVITGLSVLSFLISQLHRILALFENGKNNIIQDSLVVDKEFQEDFSKILFVKEGEIFKVYMSLTAKFGDSFRLKDLYQISSEKGLPHPHISIRNFRNSGVLNSVGDGLFSWRLIST